MKKKIVCVILALWLLSGCGDVVIKTKYQQCLDKGYERNHCMTHYGGQ